MLGYQVEHLFASEIKVCHFGFPLLEVKTGLAEGLDLGARRCSVVD